MKLIMNSPEVVRHGIFNIQICVPEGWTDDEAVDFANIQGRGTKWIIRREGDKDLLGDLERQPCEERNGCIHIMFDC